MCDKYLMLYCKEIITDILKDTHENKHFSININFIELSGNDPNLGNNFLRDPEKSLEEWNKALQNVQTNLTVQSEENYIFKKNAHCRIYSLPLYPELHRTKCPQSEDTNKFLQVSGTVVRMTTVKVLEYQRQYICTKCKYIMMVNAEYGMKNIITPPKNCGNPEECRGSNVVSLGELKAEFCKDYQEIKMQETVSKLDVSSMPNSMWVTLEDDLVYSCKPGDNITVCGLVKRRQNQFVVGKKMEIELVIKANHIHVNNNNTSTLSLSPELKDMFHAFWRTYADTPLVARDIILKSICPQLFGLYIVKLALAVVLAGGSTVHNTSSTGVRVRAEPHLLIVGDPGTGKSELLRFASKVIPRSVLTTGVGSTAAGLTVAAVMENGEWQLEGGALVMADGGICCIDEFNTMKEHDRTSIHEAMEQQTISVAKASIVCKLSTRCTILAATNPKGNLDPLQPLNMNIALPSPLLSRFDLILLLRDKIDDQWDSQLVDYIFNSFKNCNISKLSQTINWSIETLQGYFAVIKKIQPVLKDDSNRILSGYYQAQRRQNYRNKSRTTVRLLDSLVRLSQGHARLMYHQEVEIVDAIVAVILVETAMEAESSIFNLRFNLRGDFPQDPTSNYRELVEIVLKKLNLNELIEKELRRIDNVKPPGRSGPNIRNSTAVTATRTESKFFHMQKATEADATSKDENTNESIDVSKRNKNNTREFGEGCSTDNKYNRSVETQNVGQVENNEINKKTKTSNTNHNLKSTQTTKNKDEEIPKSQVAEGDVNICKKEIREPSLSAKRKKPENTIHPKKMKLDNKKNKDEEIPKSQVAEGDVNICKKEIREPSLCAKRKKPENTIHPKKMKLDNKENEAYHDDLAALKCMPSVNDIFNMSNYDSDDDGAHFEQNTNVDISIENVSGTPSNIGKGSTTTFTGDRKRDDDKVEKVEGDKKSEQTPEVLSQRTRTRNVLSKFRFIPKEDKSNQDKSLQNRTTDGSAKMSAKNDEYIHSKHAKVVPSHPSKDLDSDQCNDISFTNVVSSTQTEKLLTPKKKTNPFESENFDFGDISFANAKPGMDLERRSMHGQTTATDEPSVVKRFNFKKIVNSDNPQTVVSKHASSSIFENEEDFDNLDLDI